MDQDQKENSSKNQEQAAVIVSLISQRNQKLEDDLASERKKSFRLFIALCCGVGLNVVTLIALKGYPKHSVVNTVDNSVICPIEASKNPRVTDAVISDFAKSAILSVYNFNFLNWREVITNSGNIYFTEKGKDELMHQLATSSTVSRVVQGNLIMKTMADMPQVEERNLLAPEPHWIVTVPLTTQFYTSSSQAAETHKFIARLKVVEYPRSAKNYNGIAVSVVGLTPVR